MNQFQKDLTEKGHPVEREALYFIRKYLDEKAYQVDGHCKECDIICPSMENPLYIEVKNQNEARVSVAIETKYNQEPSGINHTKSDYWIIKCKDNFHMINTSVLRELIKFKREHKYIIQGKKVKMKLLDIQELIDNSIRIFLGSELGGNNGI